VGAGPDFWLIECDTFWKHVPPAVGCAIIAGPAEMLGGREQWLVRTDSPPAVPEDKRRFTEDDWVGSHKITATTCPEMHGVTTSES
jgi:hypothetical protein